MAVSKNAVRIVSLCSELLSWKTAEEHNRYIMIYQTKFSRIGRRLSENPSMLPTFPRPAICHAPIASVAPGSKWTKLVPSALTGVRSERHSCSEAFVKYRVEEDYVPIR